jgi:hypothetical protein
MELIGTKPISRLLVSSSNTPEVRLLSSTSITRLLQYYEPVRHPTRPSLLLTEFSLRATTSHRWGFPCFVPSPCACMPSPLPRRDHGDLSFNTPHDGGLPHILAGSAPASCLFEACSAFTQVTACLLAESPTRPFSPKASAILLPPSPLRLLPAGTTVAGRDSHPLKMHDFSRRTRMAGMRRQIFNICVVILVGEGWGLLATHNASTPVLMIAGAASGILFACLFRWGDFQRRFRLSRQIWRKYGTEVAVDRLSDKDYRLRFKSGPSYSFYFDELQQLVDSNDTAASLLDACAKSGAASPDLRRFMFRTVPSAIAVYAIALGLVVRLLWR